MSELGSLRERMPRAPFVGQAGYGAIQLTKKGLVNALEDMLGFTGSTCDMPEFKRRLKVALKKLKTADTPDALRVEDFVLAPVNGVLTITVYLSRWNEQRTMSPEEQEFNELD